jgi:hypothetical protein
MTGIPLASFSKGSRAFSIFYYKSLFGSSAAACSVEASHVSILSPLHSGSVTPGALRRACARPLQ